MATAEATTKAPSSETEAPDFSISSVLSRMRGTLTWWISTLVSVAAVVFGGVSLSDYRKLPATADPATADIAQLCMALVVLGVVITLFSAGWSASMQAAPQDGAFKNREDAIVDPLRFFPKNKAHELLTEYETERNNFTTARTNKNMEKMAEATFWMTAHAERLWLWLEAYRARKASEVFRKAVFGMALGVLLTGVGAIGFADAMRRMQSPLPANVIVQGPKNGVLTLLDAGKKDEALKGLQACMTTAVNGTSVAPITIMSVKVPATPEQVAAGVTYVAEVVPPLTGKPACQAKVYTVDNTKASVAVTTEPPAHAAPTAAAEPDKGTAGNESAK